LKDLEKVGADREVKYSEQLNKSEKQISELQEQINGLFFSGENHLNERFVPPIGNFFKVSGESNEDH
jgi:hypothetical protein